VKAPVVVHILSLCAYPSSSSSLCTIFASFSSLHALTLHKLDLLLRPHPLQAPQVFERLPFASLTYCRVYPLRALLCVIFYFVTSSSSICAHASPCCTSPICGMVVPSDCTSPSSSLSCHCGCVLSIFCAAKDVC
jgi:hypothetical protein